MIRGTTPTHTFTFSVDLSDTQEETLAFDHATMVEMQAKVLTTGGTVLASNIFTTHADRILNEEVLV